VIHYHGTPIGGAKIEVARFLVGRHALVPWTYPCDLEAVMECCQSFVLDNGAFTIWRKGGEMDAAGYVAWCEGIYRHPCFDWALIPDVIDGDEQENDAMLAEWPRKIPGVPVFHLHESLERAERLSHEWPIVALGSSGQWDTPGTRDWWHRMNELKAAFCNKGQDQPRCKLHGLRMLNPAIFSNLPLHSADSTNAAQNGARNGALIDPKLTSGQGAIITAMRIENHQSSAAWKFKKVESSGLLFA